MRISNDMQKKKTVIREYSRFNISLSIQKQQRKNTSLQNVDIGKLMSTIP